MSTNTFIADIAFSSTYIKAHPEGIRVGNTRFSQIDIAPQSSYTFGKDVKSKARNCAFASGKGAVVTVGIEGEESQKRISMRAGGMWVVKRGMNCAVQNATMGAVVLNVWAVED